jgi:hypothetical protein
LEKSSTPVLFWRSPHVGSLIIAKFSIIRPSVWPLHMTLRIGSIVTPLTAGPPCRPTAATTSAVGIRRRGPTPSCWPSIWPTGAEVPHRRCSRRACGARATTCDSLGGRDGRRTSLKHGHGGGGGKLQEGARVVRPQGRRPYLRGGGCGYEKGRERTTGLEVR